jgi:predicted Zn finger-like uncharacterized protein
MNSTVTQCPECATRFKVSEEQLSASEGMVRCGRCNAVFNATEHFVSDEPSPQLALAIEIDDHSRVEERTEQHSPSEKINASTPIAQQLNLNENSFTEGSTLTPPAKQHRWPWLITSTLMLLTLLAQATYFFRVEIAAYLPGSKPLLSSYCHLLKCTIPLPRKAELLSIESSDLEANSNNPNAIILNALLHNRANHVQAFPNLELSLTDVQDKLVARRTFAPVSYLKDGEDEKTGLAPNRELTIKLHLDTADLKPTGYKLFLFYP